MSEELAQLELSEERLLVLEKVLGNALASKKKYESNDYQTIQFLHATVSEELKEIIWRRYVKEKNLL